MSRDNLGTGCALHAASAAMRTTRHTSPASNSVLDFTAEITMARTNDDSGKGKGHAKERQGKSGGRGGPGKTGSTKSQHAKKEGNGYGSTGSKSSGGSGSSESSGGGHGGTHG